MGDPYIGEIRIFPYNYAPLGWLECGGQVLNVSQYQALAAILGNIYGGSIRAGTFALPNLRECAPIGMGQGPGLTPRTLQPTPVGAPTVTLTNISQLPTHTHGLQVRTGNTKTEGQNIYVSAPTANRLSLCYTRASSTGTYGPVKNVATSSNVSLGSQTVAPAYAATPAAHPNLQPYLAFRFCIATDGVFPIKP
jgi:microcystin-dependent protein